MLLDGWIVLFVILLLVVACHDEQNMRKEEPPYEEETLWIWCAAWTQILVSAPIKSLLGTSLSRAMNDFPFLTENGSEPVASRFAACMKVSADIPWCHGSTAKHYKGFSVPQLWSNIDAELLSDILSIFPRIVVHSHHNTVSPQYLSGRFSTIYNKLIFFKYWTH